MLLTRRSALAAAAALSLMSAGFGGASFAAPVITCAPPASPAATAAAVAAASPAALDQVDFPAEGGKLTVFAAASLTEAFQQIATDLTADNPALEITFNFAGSQALVTQMKEGARADVFASANGTQMNAAKDAGLIEGAAPVFVQNHLAVVVPAANPAKVDDATDLSASGLKLVLAQPEVPAGKYAREAICTMGDTAFVEAVAANVVSEEEDVRDVLAKVELGEADAGIVYETDALAGGDKVLSVAMPADADPVARYPVAAVKGGNEALAEAFIT
ncbi:MAG: molybdate ABC transporter substrate-binding protein, partial [Thermomicrobiales bacterium]